MACKNCKFEHLVAVGAKCSDLCNVDYNGQSKQGYVPDDIGIGGGDYIEFDYCPNCGMMYGDFPKTINLGEEDEIDEENLESSSRENETTRFGGFKGLLSGEP